MLGADYVVSLRWLKDWGMVVVEAQAAGLGCLLQDTTPRECVVMTG